MPSEPNGTNWLEWALSTTVGLIIAISGYAFNYIFTDLSSIRKEMNELRDKQAMSWTNENRDLWAALDDLREKVANLTPRTDMEGLRRAIEDDRRVAAQDRASIAAAMVSRAELDRQLDMQFQRLVQALGGHRGAAD